MEGLINIRSKDAFKVKNKSQTKAEMVFYGDIGPWEDWGDISANLVDRELKKLPETVNELDVRINSGGGDVFEGYTIFNRLKQHKAEVTVYIDGLAASIASIIAMAGDKIVMGEGALMMIHKPWTWARGDSNELESTIERLLDIEEQLVNTYKKKTGLDRSELKAMLASETWMDGDQALEKGFVTELFQSEESIAASAVDKKWIKRRPNIKDGNVIAKEKISQFQNDIQKVLARSKT
jgi:ATP-dependent protease ClpP protease subunit